MGKVQRRGVKYQCLDERECTIKEVVSSLRLKPLTKKEELELRDQLGFALGKWEEPYSGSQNEDVIRSLRAHVKWLDKVESLGAITRMGYARADELEVSALLTETLASDSKIGSIEAARNYQEDFCGRARVVAAACRRAAGSLQSNKGKSGRSRYQWHDEFTAVLVDLCKRNKIEPNVAIDRESGEPTGGLFEVASRFEQLFPAAIRSPTPAALVKRLQRSLKR